MPIPPAKPRPLAGANLISPPARVRSRQVMQSGDTADMPDRGKVPGTNQLAGYTVGYGKPPAASRFRPGQSGNPRGRPRAAKGLNVLVRDTLTQKVAVRTPSGEKRISRIEAALHKTVELAMKGNPRALAQLIKLYAQAVPDARPGAGPQPSEEDLTATDVAMLEELRTMLLAEQE